MGSEMCIRDRALLISDVTGDAPADIASGPCAPDYSTYQDALDILAKHHLGADAIPGSVLSHLQRGVAGEVLETLKEADLKNVSVKNHVIATAYKSLEAAAKYVRTQGYEPMILGDTITGEAQEVGTEQAALARQYLLAKTANPIALISGGECTVTCLLYTSDAADE